MILLIGKNAALISRGVALLRNGNSWASAVALDAKQGIFLTCAHVLKVRKKWHLSPYTRAKRFYIKGCQKQFRPT